MTRCWRPGCPRDAHHRIVGDDWAIDTCPRHLTVACSVTGRRPPRDGRKGQSALFDVADGGGA